jgi:hypothetical protein
VWVQQLHQEHLYFQYSIQELTQTEEDKEEMMMMMKTKEEASEI